MANVPSLRLLQQLDDENVPVEYNIFDSTPAHELVEELCRQANFFVARKLASAMPEKAFLRRQASPNPRRLTQFVDRMNRLGFGIDSSSSGSLQSSLCKVGDVEIRKVRWVLKSVPESSDLLILIAGYGDFACQSHAACQIFCWPWFCR